METSNRETILETAVELFALQGFEATGIQAIVDKANVSKPTLYHHFGHKRGLLDTIVAEYGRKLTSIVDRSVAYNHDITMNLTVLTREYIAFALSNQFFYRLYVALCVSGPGSESYAACLPLRDAINESVEQLFVAATADHGNMKGRAKIYTQTLLGVIDAWALLVINKEIALDDATLNRIVHQYMHGIFS
jgi:TetR/AcrR family transcriptional regulator